MYWLLYRLYFSIQSRCPGRVAVGPNTHAPCSCPHTGGQMPLPWLLSPHRRPNTILNPSNQTGVWACSAGTAESDDCAMPAFLRLLRPTGPTVRIDLNGPDGAGPDGPAAEDRAYCCIHGTRLRRLLKHEGGKFCFCCASSPWKPPM